MATKKTDAVPDNMAVLELGGWGCTLIMPVTDACEVLKLLERAKPYYSEYRENTTKIHIGGDLPTLTMKLVSGDHYVEGLINGPRPKD